MNIDLKWKKHNIAGNCSKCNTMTNYANFYQNGKLHSHLCKRCFTKQMKDTFIEYLRK